MNKFGKNIFYTNGPSGKDLNILMFQIKILVKKDFNNQRSFRITFGVGTVEVKVYAILLETSKPSLVETITLSKGVTVSNLTTLDDSLYVVKDSYSETEMLPNMVFFYEYDKGFTASEWSDQGVNNINAVQSDVSYQPSLDSNSILFETDDYLTLETSKEELAIEKDEGFELYVDFQIVSMPSSGFLFSSGRLGSLPRGIGLEVSESKIWFDLFGDNDADGAFQIASFPASLGTNRHQIKVKFNRKQLKTYFFIDGSLVYTQTNSDPGRIGCEYEATIGKHLLNPIGKFNGRIYKMYLEKNVIKT